MFPCLAKISNFKNYSNMKLQGQNSIQNKLLAVLKLYYIYILKIKHL